MNLYRAEVKVSFEYYGVGAIPLWKSPLMKPSNLPDGWSLYSCSGSDGTATFRVDGELLEKDGEAVAAILEEIRKGELKDEIEEEHFIIKLINDQQGGANNGKGNCRGGLPGGANSCHVKQ